MNYEPLIEKLLTHYTGGTFANEVQGAKREFFENAGVVDEDSGLYDLRMSQFLDWYLFSRDLTEQHVPPIVDAFRVGLEVWDDVEIEKIKVLVNHRHSLFELVKSRAETVVLKDLFDGDKIEVWNSQLILGVEKKTVFEARLYLDGEHFQFTRGLCIHPPEARKFILNELKKCRDSELQERRLIMLRLMKLRYKFEVYKHVSLKEIYSEELKFRV